MTISHFLLSSPQKNVSYPSPAPKSLQRCPSSERRTIAPLSVPTRSEKSAYPWTQLVSLPPSGPPRAYLNVMTPGKGTTMHPFIRTLGKVGQKLWLALWQTVLFCAWFAEVFWKGLRLFACVCDDKKNAMGGVTKISCEVISKSIK